MAYTTINKSTDYFNTKLYTGTGSSNALTGVGFQPDWTWIKKRDGTNYHVLTDAVRLATKQIYSNDTGAEQTVAEGLKSFDSDGFTLGTNGDTNGNGGSYVGWNWKANGSGSANTDGSQSSTVSVNTAAGFSIVKYTGYGAATYGHGLGTTPQMIIIKKLNSSNDWFVYHHKLLTPSATQKQFILLNSTAAFASNGSATTFTSVSNSTFGVGTDDKISESGDSFIAYCFAEKTGYSKFGSYTGNGNADGTFVYTGFKPAFLIIKRTDTTKNWYMHDIKRDGYNTDNPYLSPNLNASETGGTELDLYSNGFKMRSSGTGHNESGGTYIYMAFGQSLVGSNNVPCTAR
jgi:hypothetical protein